MSVTANRPLVRPDESTAFSLSSSPLFIFSQVFILHSILYINLQTLILIMYHKHLCYSMNKIGFRLQSNLTKLFLYPCAATFRRATTFNEKFFIYKAIKLVIIAYLKAIGTKTLVSLTHEVYLPLHQCFPNFNHVYTTCTIFTVSMCHLYYLYISLKLIFLF